MHHYTAWTPQKLILTEVILFLLQFLNYQLLFYSKNWLVLQQHKDMCARQNMLATLPSRILPGTAHFIFEDWSVLLKENRPVPKHRITSHHKLVTCNLIPWMLNFFLPPHNIFLVKKKNERRMNANWVETYIFWQTVMTFPIEIYI